MKKVLLFTLAVSAAFFLSCSADFSTGDVEDGQYAVLQAIGEQAPDGKMPIPGGVSVGGGVTGACYASDGIDDVCEDGVSEEECRNQAGAYFDSWEEGETCD